jgi:hypothetical protein
MDLFAWPASNTPKWLLLGPARSGSCVHVDPLKTSAWNALLKGTKHWVLFSPQFAKHFVESGCGGVMTDGVRDFGGGMMNAMRTPNEIALCWYEKTLPEIKSRLLEIGVSGDTSQRLWSRVVVDGIKFNANQPEVIENEEEETEGFRGPMVMMEFLQHPGETIFVPGECCALNFSSPFFTVSPIEFE